MNSIHVQGDITNSSIITGIGNIPQNTYMVTIHDNDKGKVFIYYTTADDHKKAKEQVWNRHIIANDTLMPDFTISEVTDLLRNLVSSKNKTLLARVLYNLWESKEDDVILT